MQILNPKDFPIFNWKRPRQEYTMHCPTCGEAITHLADHYKESNCKVTKQQHGTERQS